MTKTTVTITRAVTIKATTIAIATTKTTVSIITSILIKATTIVISTTLVLSMTKTTTAIDKNNKSNSQKRKLDGHVIPFCKDRLLQAMKSIATKDDPSNNEFYTCEFITAEAQYKLVEEFFPNLQQYCTKERLQYWVGQSNIWGPHQRHTTNGESKYSRTLWIVWNPS